jgi:hypothetical protein
MLGGHCCGLGWSGKQNWSLFVQVLLQSLQVAEPTGVIADLPSGLSGPRVILYVFAPITERMTGVCSPFATFFFFHMTRPSFIMLKEHSRPWLVWRASGCSALPTYWPALLTYRNLSPLKTNTWCSMSGQLTTLQTGRPPITHFPAQNW